MTGRYTIIFACMIALSGLAGTGVVASSAHASSATTLDTNGEVLTLETSKGVLLRLDRPASDIFITNPAIADVQVKSPAPDLCVWRGTGRDHPLCAG